MFTTFVLALSPVLTACQEEEAAAQGRLTTANDRLEAIETDLSSAVDQEVRAALDCEKAALEVLVAALKRKAALVAVAADPTAEPSRREASRTQLRVLEHNLDVFEQEIEESRVAGTLARLDADLFENEFKVKAMRHPYSKGNFSWEVLGGVEFSEADGLFSSPTGYARFIGDTAFRPGDKDRWTWRNLHALVDFAFASIPVEAVDSSSNEFIDSEKALTAALGFDWLFYQHPATEDGYHTQVGLAARAGLQTLDEDPGQDITSDNEFWGLGLTVRTSPLFRLSDPNPLPYAYGTLTYGAYDTLDERAVAFDGMIRFVPAQESELDNDDPWGLFIGVRAIVNMDEGDDDLRFQLGVQDGLALLKDLFALPGKLVSGGKGTDGA
jgi:hypothetical protein